MKIKRTWIPQSLTKIEYPDKLFIYDGGDFTGFLVECANGFTQWNGGTLLSRNINTNNTIEIFSPTHSSYTPKTFFCITEYPLQYLKKTDKTDKTNTTYKIPGWIIEENSIF